MNDIRIYKTLELDMRSHRSNLHELRMRAIISANASICDDLDGFYNSCLRDVFNAKPSNNVRFENSYRFYRQRGLIECWHLNCRGDKDRLICKVKMRDENKD